MYEAREMDGSPVVARGEASKVLETAKAAFDPVALSVDNRVVGDRNLTGSI